MRRPKYKCSKCGAKGIKLWRQYQRLTDGVHLLCFECAVEDQNANRSEFLQKIKSGETDQIKWLVPAVPVGKTFWGYTSVPDHGVFWWNSLPLYRGG
jgi:hypothetical protein